MHKNHRHINHIDINQLHRLGKVNTNRWQYVARYVIPISWWAHTEADRNKTIVKLALMKVIRIGIAQLSPLSPLTVANNKTIKPQQQHIPPNWLPPFDGYLSDHAWNSTPPLLSLSSGRVGVSKKDNTIWLLERKHCGGSRTGIIYFNTFFVVVGVIIDDNELVNLVGWGPTDNNSRHEQPP